MTRRQPTTIAALALLLAACDAEPPRQTPGPQLPPLALAPFLPRLKELAAVSPPAPAAAALREVQELADIALQIVAADQRTAARAERSLLEHEHALAALLPALQAKDAPVRRRAAWLVARTGRAIAQFGLLLRLKDETDAETSVWLAHALHCCGNDTGLGWLDAAIDNPALQETAGQLAVELLRDLGTALSEQPTWAELQTALRARAAAWTRTGKGSRANTTPPDPAATDAILAAHLLATEGTALRPVDEARFVLVRSGALALPLLRAALAASEPYLRTMALQVLADLGPAAAPVGDAVLPLLGDPLTASYAMRALGELGHAAAVPHLRAGLTAVDTEARAASAHALGLLGDQDSSARFAQLLGDANESLDVRVQAAFAILCLQPDAAAEAFVAAREQQGDYHAPVLQRLRERLAALHR